MERFLTITSEENRGVVTRGGNRDGGEPEAEKKSTFEGGVANQREKVVVTVDDGGEETDATMDLYFCKDYTSKEDGGFGEVWTKNQNSKKVEDMYYYDDDESKYRSFSHGQAKGIIAERLKIMNEEVNTVSTLTIDGTVAPESYEESEIASLHIKGEVTDKVVTVYAESGKYEMYFVSVEESYIKTPKGDQKDNPLLVAVMKQNTTSPKEIYIMSKGGEYFVSLADMAYKVKITWKITNVAPSKSAQQVETAQTMFSNLLDKVSEATTVAEARGAARTAEIFNHKYLQDAMANII